MKRQERKETANKGFSLVELIIVIAIMAVLIGVLAPQYLRYVERSRVSADATTADEFERAMQVLASDPDVTLDSTATYTVTSTTAGAITISDDLTDLFDDTGVLDTGRDYEYRSTSYRAQATTLTLTWDTTTENWEVTRAGFPTT